MLYILLGEDDFSLREALRGIKADMGDAESLATNTSQLNATGLTLNQLKGICDTIPFLAPKRLVIVDGLLKRFESKVKTQRRKRHSASVQGDEWSTFNQYIKEMPSTTVLVLTDGKIAGDNPFLRQLSGQATVMNFPRLKWRNLQQWIEKRVAQGDGSISPAAVRLLAQLVGDNLWVMNNEIDKLLLYVSGHRIEESDVEQVVSYTREANIFAMVDAVLEGQIGTAQQLLHRLLSEGASPPYLLVMLGRQLRLMVQIKELTEQKMPVADIQSRLRLFSEYALKKIKGQSTKYSIERLKSAYSRLLDTDLSVKTGKYGGELALDILIVDLCHLSR